MSTKTTTPTTQEPTGEPKDAEQQQAPEAEQRAADTTPAEQEPKNDPQDEAKGGGNKEAARYRRQLREVETERDVATSTVETLRRQLVAGAMTTKRISPEALWATGHNAGEFFDESGQLDVNKLSDITKATAKTLGVPIQDVIPESGRRYTPEPTTTWSDALKRRA